MVASIGAIASPSQGASYYERDGYYARDDPAHRDASAWAGKGAEALGLAGPVDPGTFQAILEGKVPDGPHLGKRGKDGEIHHRPGRDVTMSAPKSVSLMAIIGGDERVVAAHDRAVRATLGWIEKNAILTRMQDPGTDPGQARAGAMVHAGDQNTVVATFRHETSRNLDPQLHTHCVIANMVRGGDGKWRTMVNDGLYRQQKAISAIYRAELAEGLARLGYGIERTHADGRFEIAGVSREVVEAFSTRRAEIEAAMKARGFDDPAENKRIADRAALMTRAAKRDVDKGALRGVWEKQAAGLGFSPERVLDAAREREPETATWGRADRESLLAGKEYFVTDAIDWAVEHLSERQAVFSHADLLAAALSYEPGSATVTDSSRGPGARREAARRDRPGTRQALGDRGRGRAGMGDRRADAGGQGGGRADHAPLGRHHQAPPGLPQRRPEGGGEDHPLHQGPGGRGAGLCRDRQDGDAGPIPNAFRKRGLPDEGSRPVGLGGAHIGRVFRHKERDPATVPRPPCGDRGRPGHAPEPARAARRAREDDPGGGRILARLQRADAGPVARRDGAAASPGGAGGRRETARWGGSRKTLCAVAAGGNADGGHGGDPPSARSGAERGGAGEPRGRGQDRSRSWATGSNGRSRSISAGKRRSAGSRSLPDSAKPPGRSRRPGRCATRSTERSASA